jgi:SAM-dependent methyltransferase
VSGPELDPDVAADTAVRHGSFGQHRDPSSVDRFGRWLSTRKVRRAVGPVPGRAVADVGCGYHADLARALFGRAHELVLVDLHVDPALRLEPGVRVVEGPLPGALGDLSSGALDVVLCNNVLEHLWEPELTLHEMRRLLRPGGVLIVNVPSWRGKWFLERAAFGLGIAPAEEMDDHKAYYDPKDLWPLLVKAGFRPSRIDCRRHKFGLNTLAVCQR